MCCLCKTLLTVTSPSPSPLSKLNPHHPFLIFFSSSSSTSPSHHPPSLSSNNNNSSSLSPPQTTPYILMWRQQKQQFRWRGFLAKVASSPSLSLNILTTCVCHFQIPYFNICPGLNILILLVNHTAIFEHPTL
jgi:hypothetical protein